MIAKLTAGFILLCSMTPLLAQDGALVSHPVVTGAPYWATRMITVERNLPGGKQSHHVEVRWEARNAQGWEWSRSRVQTKGVEYSEKEQLKGKGPMTYVLWNPETRQRIQWCSCGKTALAVSFDPTKPESSGDQHLRGSIDEVMNQFKNASGVTTTTIGTKWMLEMQADGTRSTRSVNWNVGGKHQASTQQVETWYSPSLHMALAEAVVDSKAGIISDSIIAMKRGEPDAELFKVPSANRVTGVAAKHSAALLEARLDQSQGVPQAAHTAKQQVATRAAKPAANAKAPQPQMTAAVVREPKITPLVGFEPVGYTTEMASSAAPAAMTNAVAGRSGNSANAAKLEKAKAYKNAPNGWPTGLPPL